MPRRKKGRKKNKDSKEIKDIPEINIKKIEDEKIDQTESIKIEETSEKEERKEIVEKKEECATLVDNNVKIQINLMEENDFKVKINLNEEKLKLEKINENNENKNYITDDNNSNDKTEIKQENHKEKTTIKNDIDKKNEKDSKLNIENSISNETHNLKEEEKKIKNKIANKDFERFIKENAKLYQYIKSYNVPIIIQNSSHDKKEEIKLKKASLLKIIKQSCLQNEIKIYLTPQIISENIQLDNSSTAKITFNQKIQNFIKDMKNLNISIPNKESDDINEVIISKEVFVNIFNKLGKNYYKEIFNYMNFMLTEVTHSYNYIKKKYNLKGVKILRRFVEQNRKFFISKEDENNYDTMIPLSNYSYQKIFNLYNGGKDTKFLLLNYKIINDDFIKYENENKNYLETLMGTSDVKLVIKKYQNGTQKNPLKYLEQEKLNNFKEIDIKDLNDYLISAEETLFSIFDQISNKKKEITKLIEDLNNQFIEVIDSSKNIKFINKQYLKLMKGEDDELNKNIYSFDFYDYNNENITVMKKNLENLSDKIYVEIRIDDKNYLVNKNKLLKIYDSWRILGQEDTIDAINTEKIGTNAKEYEIEKINIVLLDAKIIEQDVMKEIKKKESHEDVLNNDMILDNKKEKNSLDNIVIIEENINENENDDDEKILRNKRNKDNKNGKTKELFEYINGLPQKNNYNIKYKVKVERIPKKKHN